MKRCPTCRREYSDDALSFCLDDGGKLESAAPPPQQDPQATLMITPEVLRTMQTGAQSTAPIPPPQQTYTPPQPTFTPQQTFAPPPTQYSQAGAGWGAAPAAPAPPKKRGAMPFVIGGIVLLLLGGIGVAIVVVVLAMNSNTNNNNNQSANNNNNRASSPTPTPTPTGKVITSADNVTEIMVPEGWATADNLNKNASIQVSNPAKSMYAIVLTIAKSDLNTSMDLNAYSEDRANALKGTLTGLRASGPVSMTVNGESGLLYEIHGTINGFQGAYLFAVVESAQHYHQIITWTDEAKFSANRDELESVIRGFRLKS